MSTNHEPRIEEKLVKHVFSAAEVAENHTKLMGALDRVEQVEAEFDQVKASYKAKIEEASCQVANVRNAIRAGFEQRTKKCRVEYRPADNKKDFIPVDDPAQAVVLTEEMEESDRQIELIQAESAFDRREEIELWAPTDHDRGVLAVGRLRGKWYGALRVVIGGQHLTERLDSEQATTKKRVDTITRKAKALRDWLKDKLGVEAAKGFIEPVEKALEAHAEREE